MKQNTNSVKNQEENRMKKYIVEAPELKEGQKVSSGGIRENGKLAAQFKNPVPYKGPTLPPSVINQHPSSEIVRKNQARSQRKEVGMYLLGLTWQEFGEPLLRSGLRKLRQKLVDKHEFHTVPSDNRVSAQKPEIIEVKAVETKPVYDDEKIICFPNSKAV
jgi:hypothetical protein